MANSDMVNSLIKAMDILDAVANVENGIRLNELAESFDMKKSTASNLVRTLRARNYLIKDSTNRLHLGPAIQNLLRSQDGHTIIRQAMVVLRDLYKKWPTATLSFSEVCNGEIFCRLRMSADQPGFIQRPNGQIVPPYTSATSLIMMAMNTDYVCAVETRFPFSVYGINRWPDSVEFEKTLSRFREHGFSIVLHEAGSYALAIPVVDRFAVGVHFMKNSISSPEQAGAILVESVANITAISEA